MKRTKTTIVLLTMVVVIGLTFGSGLALAGADKYDKKDDRKHDKKDKKKHKKDKKDKKKKHKKKVPACKKSQGAAKHKNPHCKKKKY